MAKFTIAVFPGDGIGNDITKPSADFIGDIAKGFGVDLGFEYVDAGAYLYAKTGDAFPEENFQFAAKADAIYLAAMGDPAIRYPDGREIGPQHTLRKRLQLYAGVRPCIAMPGAVLPLKDPRADDLDFVVVRESTEGMMAFPEKSEMDTPDEAYNIMKISRKTSEKLFRFSFEYARKRKAAGKSAGKVSCLNKANVLSSQYFFMSIFDEICKEYPDIETEHMYVDAAAMNFVRKPWTFDVCPVENAYGDVLTDLTAALMGGIGMAPSGEIGDNNAVFQPCHGSAPKMAGTGIANPTGMVLSGAMMLEYLGDKFGCREAGAASEKVFETVKSAYAKGTLCPHDFGGSDGVKEVIAAFRRELE
ncbi:MAG: isocitrate/isopropylmalate dehydrogenase family protein [Firmicutes bacterium]|nr:isocitrate/isopropylmalate dehydrogenase family protein [Bacillota bacterium]